MSSPSSLYTKEWKAGDPVPSGMKVTWYQDRYWLIPWDVYVAPEATKLITTFETKPTGEIIASTPTINPDTGLIEIKKQPTGTRVGTPPPEPTPAVAPAVAPAEGAGLLILLALFLMG